MGRTAVVASIVVGLVAQAAVAQEDETTTVAQSPESRIEALELELKEIKTERANEFAGISFGVGISLTLDAGENERIKSASVVNGIVRIHSEQDAIARVMLESHYFFTPPRKFLIGNVAPGNWGHGPFIALQPGTDNIIDAVALGWMIGFKRDKNGGSESWNIGIGWAVEPDVQVLGDDIVANEPLPAGETDIRFKTEAQGGLLIMASFTF